MSIDSVPTGRRIAIDAHMVGTGETGNETYVRGLVCGLRAIDARPDYLLYTTDPALLPPALVGDRFRPRRITPAGNIPRLAWAMPRAARRDRLDLLHVTYTLPPALPCRGVVSVHDISYTFFPEAFSPRDRLVLGLAVPLSLWRSERVITPSESGRRDIIRRYRVPEWKIAVIPLAAEPHFAPVRDPVELARVRARYRLPARYVLAVGNLQPRKNLGRLIAAFAALRAARRTDVGLVLVGKALWRESDIFTAVRAHGLEGAVVTTGYVPDADLPALYSAAEVFAYPSLYEGFGLPPVEAMACGTPVLTSATSSLPEVVGDAALTVDPRDVRAIAAGLEALLGDADLRVRLAGAGRARAIRFTWEETARRTLAVYEAAIVGARR